MECFVHWCDELPKFSGERLKMNVISCEFHAHLMRNGSKKPLVNPQIEDKFYLRCKYCREHFSTIDIAEKHLDFNIDDSESYSHYSAGYEIALASELWTD